MTSIHRLPGEFPELYEVHSRLADARFPMGATVTHIYRAKRWRSQDERNGEGYARRQRIRKRKAQREPIVFDHAMLVKTSKPNRTVPPSHKGYAA
jgi:hypothetical protein